MYLAFFFFFFFFVCLFWKCRHYRRWLLWLPRLPARARLSGSLNAVGERGEGGREGRRCVKGSQWMSPLIHFLIKQPALCLSHGLYLSPSFGALGRCRTREHARIHTHTRTHGHTSPSRRMKASPHGLDRNNKQQMIHDGDGECIQQDHLSDLI